ncbi:GNAT family N-acetyltransferase [Tumebacillus algifaecis]|uniref:GNAT family N-acetyltransferase n=1 Tax=Tumebacillus algifaecis TaxID=1214604 RepID=UPI0012FDD55C|nr:GNAT family N-acetyltransferase [Tumebacillus algifaecis]
MFQLYASTRRLELHAWGWDAETAQQFLQMQWKAQKQSYAAQHPHATHLLIQTQHELVGRLLFSQNEQELLLIDLSLLPEYHNQGIGTLLLQELQDRAILANLPLRLSVLLTNPANRLYTRLGFTSLGNNGVHNFMEWRPESK